MVLGGKDNNYLKDSQFSKIKAFKIQHSVRIHTKIHNQRRMRIRIVSDLGRTDLVLPMRWLKLKVTCLLNTMIHFLRLVLLYFHRFPSPGTARTIWSQCGKYDYRLIPGWTGWHSSKEIIILFKLAR